MPAEAQTAIDGVARERGSEVVPAWDGVTVEPVEPCARRADTRFGCERRRAITATSRISLRGAHQIGNAVVAVRLLELLDQRGIGRAGGRDRRAAWRT